MSSDVDVMKQNKDDLSVSGWFNFGQELSIRKQRRRKRNKGLWPKLWWKLPVAKETTVSCFSSSRLSSEVHVCLHFIVASYTPASPHKTHLYKCFEFTYNSQREVLLCLHAYLTRRIGGVLMIGVVKLLLKVIKCLLISETLALMVVGTFSIFVKLEWWVGG